MFHQNGCVLYKKRPLVLPSVNLLPSRQGNFLIESLVQKYILYTKYYRGISSKCSRAVNNCLRVQPQLTTLQFHGSLCLATIDMIDMYMQWPDVWHMLTQRYQPWIPNTYVWPDTIVWYDRIMHLRHDRFRPGCAIAHILPQWAKPSSNFSYKFHCGHTIYEFTTSRKLIWGARYVHPAKL